MRSVTRSPFGCRSDIPRNTPLLRLKFTILAAPRTVPTKLGSRIASMASRRRLRQPRFASRAWLFEARAASSPGPVVSGSHGSQSRRRARRTRKSPALAPGAEKRQARPHGHAGEEGPRNAHGGEEATHNAHGGEEAGAAGAG